MKTKTCKRSDCKFFHITGTKKEERATNNQERKNDNVPNGNLNQKVYPQSVQPTVFQETRQPWEIAIEKIIVSTILGILCFK